MKGKINIKKIKNQSIDFILNNKLFLSYVVISLLMGFLLRVKTINGHLYFKAFVADLLMTLLIGSFGYLINKKSRFIYYLSWLIFNSLICVGNTIYYGFYQSFISVNLISTASMVSQVNDALFAKLHLHQFVYLLFPITFIFIHKYLKKNNYYENIVINSKRIFKRIYIVILILLIFLLCTFNKIDGSRFVKLWNRESVVSKYGVYVYTANDLIQSIRPRLNSLFGYDEAAYKFREYYACKFEEKKETNEYTNIFKGKNLLLIHAESIQNFLIDLKINNKEVTPNLNKLTREGMYFNKFYPQISVGTSSDTEFTFNTSLMPAKYGTAFSNYFDKKYVSMPQLLKDKGYYTYSLHANVGDFWNRRIMHANLGYDDLYDKKTYEIDDVIGLGLSDESFLRQSVTKIKKINEDHSKWFGYVITLSNHTPFSDLDKYGEFDVDIKEGDQVYSYMEGTKMGRYLKSVHYADYALGVFFAELEKEGLLDNTAIVLFGDHDARLPENDFVRLYNYDKTTDSILPDTDPRYVKVDDYKYELDRKTPLIIWTKDSKGTKMNKKVSYYMGMYDVMPTLGNMVGVSNKYALGHDIFNIKDNNIIVFPTGNWLTKDMYYNNQKEEGYAISGGIISEDYITKNSKHSDELLEVSNNILIYDLIRNANIDKTKVNEQNIVNGDK